MILSTPFQLSLALLWQPGPLPDQVSPFYAELVMGAMYLSSHAAHNML